METTVRQVAVGRVKSRNWFLDLMLRLIREKPMGTVGAAIVILLLFAGVFANFLAPYGMNQFNLDAIKQPPSATHWLGTDDLGRDMLSRIIYGARISMYVGLGASALEVLVALLLGGVSGLIGGTYDLLVQRIVDAWMCFPPLFILLSVMAILGQGIATVILVLGVSGGIGASRVVRSAVIGIKENTYVSASQSVGCTRWELAIRHILPNIMASIIIIFTLAVGGMILTEATLSFLGMGIPPPQPSWGSMLSGPSRANLISAPWMAIWPGLALAIVVYGVNMLGDAMRDLLDPRLRGGLGSYSTGKKVERARRRVKMQGT